MKWIALVALTAVGFACNMISGADNIRLDDDDDDDEGASGVPVTAAGTGGATTTGSANGGATSTTAQQANSAVSSTSSGTPCTYPTGPYGVAQGQVVPPTLTWQGYAPGSNSVTTISIQDIFDCDGSKGINAVMIDTSQFG